ncbi:transglycosylase SLT domain-containing protein [Tropicimonas sp. TH_r6]|uniref:transglycosylase SLT domain-containing protein n=1 Tax=Tropicimonas sp. TH_r6 TaxID=3082085 RepID=UPI002955C97F|nr:transglycosylase SLT domain-containing protein [Tropicimonas sp. TH_r6]MDV7141943.1 transglycosylase SLT domain-containing protein [Tropicimonas sp. TH_r6]
MFHTLPRAVCASFLLGAFVLSGCAETSGDTTASTKAPTVDYDMRWDHRTESDDWTKSALSALRSHGSVLPSMVPRDIETWCPGYIDASQEDREAFWIGLISALAKHESTWNPSAVGGGGRWFGLVQIAPPTARGYSCKATSGAALKNGSDNVSCAIRIMSHTVARDGVVSQGMRGVAADWGPFHSSSKRSDMIAWTKAQPFCQPNASLVEEMKDKGPMVLFKGKSEG